MPAADNNINFIPINAHNQGKYVPIGALSDLSQFDLKKKKSSILRLHQCSVQFQVQLIYVLELRIVLALWGGAVLHEDGGLRRMRGLWWYW